MNVIKFLTLTILLTISQYASSCSCARYTICEYYSSTYEPLIFSGNIIDFIEYEDGYHSIIVVVNNTIISSTALTDTIEIIGGNQSSLCEKNWRWTYFDLPYYFAFYTDNVQMIEIDSLPVYNESFWRFSPGSCGTELFKINEKEGVVNGYITPDFSTYPLEKFEQRIANCDFNLSDIEEDVCSDVYISPNPIEGNQIYFQSLPVDGLISDVKIYSLKGELLFQKDGKLVEKAKQIAGG